MSRLYYLLRNNRQSGPYSPDILAALPLNDKDLIKAAGENTGWFHPYELGLPFIKNGDEKFLPANEVFLLEPAPAEPAAAIDHSIEQLSQKVTEMHKQLKLVERTLQEDVSKIKKTKGRQPVKIKSSALIFTIAGLLLFAAVTTALMLNNSNPKQKQISSAGSTKSNTENKPPDKHSVAHVEDSAVSLPKDATDTAHIPAAAGVKKTFSFTPKKRKNSTAKNRPSSSEHKVFTPFHQEAAGITQEKMMATITYVSPEEEQTSFFQKIFKKKKDYGSNKSVITANNIEDKLPVIITTTNYSWLTGVQGLVLTVGNNSSQYVKQAVVNVIYYNDQNGVMEKQTLFFNNIPPGRSQSVAAPDHPRAHRAGSEIVSATVVKVI